MKTFLVILTIFFCLFGKAVSANDQRTGLNVIFTAIESLKLEVRYHGIKDIQSEISRPYPGKSSNEIKFKREAMLHCFKNLHYTFIEFSEVQSENLESEMKWFVASLEQESQECFDKNQRFRGQSIAKNAQ